MSYVNIKMNKIYKLRKQCSLCPQLFCRRKLNDSYYPKKVNTRYFYTCLFYIHLMMCPYINNNVCKCLIQSSFSIIKRLTILLIIFFKNNICGLPWIVTSCFLAGHLGMHATYIFHWMLCEYAWMKELLSKHTHSSTSLWMRWRGV